MTDTDVLIVGGGISGLATAWWLAQEGLSVDLWEGADRPGGKIHSTRRDGYLTERAAAMILNFRPDVARLVCAADLEKVKTVRAPAAEGRRYLLHEGRLVTVPMRLGAMVRSPLWSRRGKWRLLAEPFIPARPSQEETVSEFIVRRLGREVLEKAMEPFVAGTLAADPDQANAATTLPRLVALERRYGSITAGILVHRLLRRRNACLTDTFSFCGGMNTLVDTLAGSPGIRVATSHAVQELARDRHGWRVTAATPAGVRSLRARRLVVATPAPVAGRLLASVDRELSELLGGIRYAPVTVVHFGLDRGAVGHPLDATGFLVPRGERLALGSALTGSLWMSTLFPGRAPKGKVLLSAYLGGARAPGVTERDDSSVAGDALGTLGRLLDIHAEPEMVRIDRHREALPLYHGSYAARLRAVATRLEGLPGLYLEANYRGGVSVRDRIARGRLTARQILATLPAVRAGSGLPATPLLRPAS